jgi:hypothetical protein
MTYSYNKNRLLKELLQTKRINGGHSTHRDLDEKKEKGGKT